MRTGLNQIRTEIKAEKTASGGLTMDNLNTILMDKISKQEMAQEMDK
jgi:hypothetical protein